MAARTPALAVAAKAGIEHRVHEYGHDPRAASYGLEAAEQLGADPSRVFKTLVASIDAVLTVVIVPVTGEVDLRALGKRAALASPEDAERATGYVTGGISPLGQRRRLPTVVDVSALTHPTIYVSAGRRGLELELAPADLVSLTEARVAEIARKRPDS